MARYASPHNPAKMVALGAFALVITFLMLLGMLPLRWIADSMG